MMAYIVQRAPDGTVICYRCAECMVPDAKRTGRDDNMPVIAVVRPKEDPPTYPPERMIAY